jgi:hypothetical protein
MLKIQSTTRGNRAPLKSDAGPLGHRDIPRIARDASTPEQLRWALCWTEYTVAGLAHASGVDAGKIADFLDRDGADAGMLTFHDAARLSEVANLCYTDRESLDEHDYWQTIAHHFLKIHGVMPAAVYPEACDTQRQLYREAGLDWDAMQASGVV